MGGYKVSEFKNGTINRVVVESIMAANYLDKWSKLDNMCKYIKDNADTTVFDNFEDMIERLEKVVKDNVSDMFDSKDSFLWFGLFARFIKSEEDDNRFVEFMTEFAQSLHSKCIDEVSFDDILESKNTKDKGIVTKKMHHLNQLMDDYLNIQKSNSENCSASVEGFISENIDVKIEEISEEIDFYSESLDDLLEETVKFDSKLRNEENKPSLLAMMAYSYKEDKDLDDWLAEYAKKNNTYFVDQKKNFLHMKSDFEQWQRENILKENRKSA